MSLHVLFICGRNRLRSPTAEEVFAEVDGIETRSAGISADAIEPVSPELLSWAELIFVMEKLHREKLSSKFGQFLRDQRLVCLGIPDDYAYMQPALVQLLLRKVTPNLPR